MADLKSRLNRARLGLQAERTPAKMFILYDARARLGDTDDATVFVTANSEREARSYRGKFQADGVWYEYDLINGVAENEKMRDDIKA